MDFRPAAAKWGAKLPLVSERYAVVTTILSMFTGRVDTNHQVTSPLIAINGDTARLPALVERQQSSYVR